MYCPSTTEFGQQSLDQVNQVSGIEAGVVFGKISRDCAGIGICKVTVNTKAVKPDCNCPWSKAILKKDQFGQLAFYFPNKSLSIKNRLKFFNREFFMVGESFVLPPAIAQSLGMQNIVVDAGQYPMVKMQDYICVLFPGN